MLVLYIWKLNGHQKLSFLVLLFILKVCFESLGIYNVYLVVLHPIITYSITGILKGEWDMYCLLIFDTTNLKGSRQV